MKLSSMERKKCCLLGLIVIICIISLGMYDSYQRYQDYLKSENEYHNIHDRYTSLMARIDENLENIEDLQYELQCSGEELYFSMLDFYNNSNDEVFKYVFDERFPCRYDFYQNPGEFYVVITALKENYPELNNDEQIEKWSLEVEAVSSKLHNKINLYNKLVGEYEDTVNELNNCEYVIKKPNLRVNKRIYNDIVVE